MTSGLKSACELKFVDRAVRLEADNIRLCRACGGWNAQRNSKEHKSIGAKWDTCPPKLSSAKSRFLRWLEGEKRGQESHKTDASGSSAHVGPPKVAVLLWFRF